MFVSRDPRQGWYRVNIVHWWPGRVYQRGYCPIPEWIVKRWIKNKRRYGTFAWVNVAGQPTIAGWSECSQLDSPTRKRGRHFAITRLLDNLRIGNTNWRIVKDATPNKKQTTTSDKGTNGDRGSNGPSREEVGDNT